MKKPSLKTWKRALAQGFVFPPLESTTALPDAVKIAAETLEDHLLNSPSVRSYLEALPKGRGTDCPDSPIDELVRYVSNQKGLIDKSDPVLNLRFLKRYINPMFKLENLAVGNAIASINDVSKAEVELFENCSRLSFLTTHLWSQWFQTIVVPFQCLNEVGRAQYKLHAKDTLGQYDYTVFNYRRDEGCFNRQTWAEAFPTEISEILAVLRKLVKTEIPTLGAYFVALRDAYACQYISQLEEKWAEVDARWIRIPRTARFVPVHGMESQYEHPFGVSPEFRLEVRTSDNQEILRNVHDATLVHAATFGLNNELVALAKERLAGIDISVFVTAIRGGVCLNFRYAGQAVPNRQEILSTGGRIFLDSSASARDAMRYKEKIRLHCTSVTADTLLPLLTADSQLAATTSHEYAHPMGRTPKSDEQVGEAMNLCEEAKATLFGILAEEWSASSVLHRLALIANTVGRVIFFMDRAKLDDPTVAAYVRENIAAATMLFETGVMMLTSGGVVIDIDRAQNSVWFDALRGFNHGVLDAYQTGNKEALTALAHCYCNREDPRIAELIVWVNRTINA